MKKMFTFVAAMLLCTVAFAEKKNSLTLLTLLSKKRILHQTGHRMVKVRLPTMPPRVLSPSTFRATSLHNGKDK